MLKQNAHQWWYLYDWYQSMVVVDEELNVLWFKQPRVDVFSVNGCEVIGLSHQWCDTRWSPTQGEVVEFVNQMGQNLEK